MKNNLRKLIRKEINMLFEAIGGGVTDDAMAGLQAQLSDTGEYLDSLEKETAKQIKGDKKLLGLDRQAKSGSPATLSVSGEEVPNPERKAYDAKLPAKEKLIKAKEDGLKKIIQAKKDVAASQKELQTQQLKLAQTSPEDSKSSVLPSLGS